MAPWGQTYDNLCISIKTQKIPEKYNYTGKHKICTQITQPSLVKLLTITFCAFFRVGEKLLPKMFPPVSPLLIRGVVKKKADFLRSG